MEEIGPYRFREIRDKKNITFNKRNSTVSYRTISTFYFVEDESNGTLDDEITQLNIVAVGASAQAAHMDYKKRKTVSFGLNAYKQELAVTKTARELLFEGYEDDMVRSSVIDLRRPKFYVSLGVDGTGRVPRRLRRTRHSL